MKIEVGMLVRIGLENYKVLKKDKKNRNHWIVWRIAKKWCWAKRGNLITMSLSEEKIEEHRANTANESIMSDLFQKGNVVRKLRKIHVGHRLNRY